MNKDYDCILFNKNIWIIEPVYIVNEEYEKQFINVLKEITIRLYNDLKRGDYTW